jgi:hypothetical protein
LKFCGPSDESVKYLVIHQHNALITLKLSKLKKDLHFTSSIYISSKGIPEYFSTPNIEEIMRLEHDSTSAVNGLKECLGLTHENDIIQSSHSIWYAPMGLVVMLLKMCLSKTCSKVRASEYISY